MGFFTVAQTLLAKGRTVFFARLVEIHFSTGIERLWIDGLGTLSVDGFNYSGMGELVSIGEVTIGHNDMATQMSLVVSGVDATFIALARQSEDIRGFNVTLWGVFLSESFLPVSSRLFIAERILDVPTYSGVGPSQRGMSIPGETIWTHRDKAPNQFFSDVNQLARFPGDRGLERLPVYTGDYRVIWPNPD